MNDYKTRLIEEYKQLKERYIKLHKIIIKYDADMLDFELDCDIELLREQAAIMGKYLYILEVRAIKGHIDLEGETTK